MKMNWTRRFSLQEDPFRPVPAEAYGWRIYTTTVVASLAAAMAGYDNAYIGGTLALPSFQEAFGITPATATHLSSHIVSTLVAGCFVGSLIAYVVAEKFGRKLALFTCAGIALIGGVLQLVVMYSMVLLFLGRAVTGMSIGVLATAVPIYISEVAPAPIRGRLLGIADVSVMLAQVLGYWINYGVKIHMSSTNAQWQIPVGLQLVAPAIMILCMPTMIESPRWLVARGLVEQGRDRLAWVRNLPKDHPYVQAELDDMIAEVEKYNAMSMSGWSAVRRMWKDLNAHGMQRRLTLSCFAKVMHSMTGVAALSLYSPLIFKNIGFNNPNDELLFTGIYGAVKVFATSVFLFFFVDTWGRRKTLLSGSCLLVFSLFYLGAYTHISRSFEQPAPKDAAAWVALIMVYLFTASYAFSWATFPVIFTSEIFPTHLRALATTIVSIVQWSMHFVVAYSIPYMIKNIKYGTFYFFGAVTLCSTIAVFALYPETKGFPLEKMDLIFRGSRWARTARRVGEQRLAEEELVLDGAGGEGRTTTSRKNEKEPRTAEQVIAGDLDM